MAGLPGFVGFPLHEEFSPASPFSKRQNGCVECDTTIAPSCPTCAQGEVCQFTIQTCTSCSTAFCLRDPTTASQTPKASAGPNVGAIAGGIIGGLVAIGLVTYIVWRFCIKNKRRQYEPEHWQGDIEHTKEGLDNDFASRRSQRASTHTVHSIASTVLTRASNIIQIAYIPGVTNRATPTSPALLVPPVPPIPIAHSDGTGSPLPFDEQRFFVPGELRDSTYSGISGYSAGGDRGSYAPRSSVASTIYGKNVIVSPLPAQKGNFLKPSIVSVKSRGGAGSSGSSSGGSDTNAPPVPAVDYGKYSDQPPPSPAFSIGDTFFKNANAATATAVRPQMVRVGSGPKTVEVKAKSGSPVSSPSFGSDKTSGGGNASSTDKVRDSSNTATTILVDDDDDDDEPTSPGADGKRPLRSPFADPLPSPTPVAASALSGTSSLSAVAGPEAGVRRGERNGSPFGDENALRD
ncbi:hypothetical protein GGS23DRAFT_242033 [Durotheca rogersii]|uniref:uncharacterized protein n=1 Tax=Durotheca rogersii TaxID=419775 RepID=UPI0022200EED|nr:uncharacterized protein GGS23DRAFT_242033 [Durotheca rogersii]KAI5860263.1 hypothetical protein GGS23DRAFT_242033 [Durotheca rogersii]